ncbi:MAG: IS21-like element helper ATPase IstB [Bryobacterales bacterium]|nr:IS21-like element helper ATPase IstB [Bryobacterales bacterium]
MSAASQREQRLEQRLRELRLPSFLNHYRDLAGKARDGQWEPERYLDELVELETSERADRRITRLLREAKLPRGKTLETLQLGRLPEAVRGRTRWLCTGEFLEQATNVCVFGNPGVGKTHLMAAVGRALVERGQPVLFVAVQALVERLVEAKRDLRLARELRRLDRYACLCLDDIGYVRQDRAEMEVLFALLAERYERRSVMITSNLVFSQWNQIFHDDMTAAAAIDRVVHHSVILELTVPSYRAEAARARTQDEEK